MKEIDTCLFVEIVLSEGVTFLYRDDTLEDLNVEYYHGITGKKVAICMSDESIPALTAKQYLRQLGLEDLVDRLFPAE